MGFQAKLKPKPAADASNGPRINGAIPASYVRLVTDEGTQAFQTYIYDFPFFLILKANGCI